MNQLRECEGTHFTHLTNLAIFLKHTDISNGKDKGYEWFLRDLGLKKAITKESSQFWSGTIGFSGSHDHGTTLQRGVYNLINAGEIEQSAEQILRDGHFKILDTNFVLNNLFEEDKSEDDKFCSEIALGMLIDQKLKVNFSTEKAKIALAKERMAIAAFSSDAGWYFMVGDEKLSTITKRPFVRAADGSPFGGKEDLHDVSLGDKMPRFVKSINETFKNLRESGDKFWVEIFYLHDKKGMCFVRHLSGNQLPADVVVVNLRSETGYSIHDIKNIMDTISGYASLPKDIDTSHSELRFYFVN